MKMRKMRQAEVYRKYKFSNYAHLLCDEMKLVPPPFWEEGDDDGYDDHDDNGGG